MAIDSDIDNVLPDQQLLETEPEPYSDSSESYRPSQSSSESEAENTGNIPNFINDRPNTIYGEGSSSSLQNMGQSEVITTRKRRAPKFWKRNMVKEKRNKGEEYISYSGKTIPAKTFTATSCTCKRKCSDHVSTSLQEAIHSKFYSMDWNAQTAWLCATVKVSLPARRKKRVRGGISHKQHTRSFILSENKVCKSFFLKVLQISNKRLDYALTKKKDPETSMSIPDQRGKQVSANKIKDEVREFAKQHIESIPRYVSHYGERTSNRQYLESSLNLQKLYSSYVEKCKTTNKEPVKISYYRNIFNTYNLHFYTPKKDTCKTCDIFQIEIQNEPDLEKCLQIKSKQKEHHVLAETARSLMNSYKDKVLRDGSSCLITFDLQRTLPTPFIQTGEVYYLRQLHTLNFGTHLYLPDGEKINMNMWYETTAGRGSQEVISCLYYNILHHVPENVTAIHTFSDSCTGQNRNWNLFFFMIYMVNYVDHISEITVCYLVSGHSFLPNDSDFSDISKAQKKQQYLYTPQEWMDLIRNCRKRKPFIVTDMVGKFVDFTGLDKIMNRKGKSGNGNRILISKMRKIKFCKGDSRIYFNDDYSDKYDVADLDNEGNRERFINTIKSFTPTEKNMFKATYPPKNARFEKNASLCTSLPPSILFKLATP